MGNWVPEDREQYAAIAMLFTSLADSIMAPYAQSPGPGGSAAAQMAKERDVSQANAIAAQKKEAQKKKEKSFTHKLGKVLEPIDMVTDTAQSIVDIGNPLAGKGGKKKKKKDSGGTQELVEEDYDRYAGGY